jgi:MerR family mercuric resistance operon transcriptional regulator
MNTEAQRPLTIGALAKAANVGVETVRFYERKGLLKQPQKTSGFRRYAPADAKRIRFIKRAQELGFTLKETKELLEMERCSQETRGAIRKSAKTKIDEIGRKIVDLKQMLSALEKFSNSCGKSRSSTEECGLLECFENNWECC